MEKISKEIVINNQYGLHARPATIFVQIANKFDSSVKLEKDGDVIDGKSIIAVLSLGATKGSHLHLILEGDDASQAFSELSEFLEDND